MAPYPQLFIQNLSCWARGDGDIPRCWLRGFGPCLSNITCLDYRPEGNGRILLQISKSAWWCCSSSPATTVIVANGQGDQSLSWHWWTGEDCWGAGKGPCLYSTHYPPDSAARDPRPWWPWMTLERLLHGTNLDPNLGAALLERPLLQACTCEYVPAGWLSDMQQRSERKTLCDERDPKVSYIIQSCLFLVCNVIC